MRFDSAFASLRPLLDLIFPPRCVSCGRLGAHLCESCLAQARPIGPDICIRCGNPLTQRGLCHRCHHDPPDPIRAIRGVFFYQGPIAQGIRSLKYRGVQPLAPILAEPLVDYIRQHPSPIDGLVPVPLHPQRLAERGFNQSELLASHISQILDIPLRTDLLERIRHTPPQARLNRTQRLRNTAGAFAPRPGAKLQGETLLIIDDVATTGATLRACAEPLKQLGAGDIWALTVARAHLDAGGNDVAAAASPAEAFLLWDAQRQQATPDQTARLFDHRA